MNLAEDVPQTERAWLAAAIDGEGTLGTYKSGVEGRFRISRVCVYNTDLNFVKKAAEIMTKMCGQGIIRPTTHHLSSNSLVRQTKTCYQAVAYGWKAFTVLEAVHPWLIIKVKKAEVILAEPRPMTRTERMLAVNRGQLISRLIPRKNPSDMTFRSLANRFYDHQTSLNWTFPIDTGPYRSRRGGP